MMLSKRAHTKGTNSAILVCSNCEKTMRAGYNGNDLVRLVMPGVITLVGATAIEEYLHHHAGFVLEDVTPHIIEGIIDNV
jgi:hypothetical protein